MAVLPPLPDGEVVSVPFQQYLAKQDVQTPLLAVPFLLLARSTTAHAKHAGHSGSIEVDASTARPCMAITKVWSSIAWMADSE